MATSPTKRTLDWLRKDGWTAGVVEKWIPQTKRRLDFLGAIDIIAVSPQGTVGVQATSADNMAARRKKMCAEPNMAKWLEAGNSLWIVGWGKRGKAGKRKLWTHLVCVITVSDLQPIQSVLTGIQQSRDGQYAADPPDVDADATAKE